MLTRHHHHSPLWPSLYTQVTLSSTHTSPLTRVPVPLDSQSVYLLQSASIRIRAPAADLQVDCCGLDSSTAGKEGRWLVFKLLNYLASFDHQTLPETRITKGCNWVKWNAYKRFVDWSLALSYIHEYSCPLWTTRKPNESWIQVDFPPGLALYQKLTGNSLLKS